MTTLSGILVVFLATSVAAYNIAVFAPDISNSQLIFTKRVAEALAHGGHSVTIFIIQSFESPPPKVSVDPIVKMEFVNASSGHTILEFAADMSDVTFKDIPMTDRRQWERFAIFEEMARSCEQLVINATFSEHLRSQKFDIAFTHIYTYCNIGVIKAAGVPSWIWLNSGPLAEHVADAIGVPAPPSYCSPTMMDGGENLTFIERIKSVAGHLITTPLTLRKTADVETAIFRKHHGSQFPHLNDLAKRVPLVMVNSNELYDFARPTLHKVIHIGGIGIKNPQRNELQGIFANLTSAAREGIVVVTFGSFVPMHMMPDSWKESFARVFNDHPEVQFFMRYEQDDEWTSTLPKNVFHAKWLPQSDLLLHERCRGLITHGGYNSLQDALHAGVPAITIPLFGDQPRNGHLAEKLGMGINAKKSQVSDGPWLSAALGWLLRDSKYVTNAKKMRAMIAARPVSSEQLLVKWTELAAEFKTMENLIPFGVHLDFVTYYSLDVMAFFLLVTAVTLWILIRILKGLAALCCGAKQKVEKSKSD